MRLKLYSIALLLSFLAILGHDVIPHHEHGLDKEIISNHKHDQDCKHSHSDDQEHHDCKITTCVYKYVRLSVKSEFSIKVVSLFLSQIIGINPFNFEPPELSINAFTDKPFLINSILKPGAIGLRAPPYIACLEDRQA